MRSNDELIEVNEVILVLVESFEDEVSYNSPVILREDGGQHLPEPVLGQDTLRTVQEELPKPFSNLCLLEVCVLCEERDIIVCEGPVTFHLLFITPLLENH